MTISIYFLQLFFYLVQCVIDPLPINFPYLAKKKTHVFYDVLKLGAEFL